MLLYIILGFFLLAEILTVFALQSISKQSKRKNKKLAWGLYWLWTGFIFSSIVILWFNRESFSEPAKMNIAFTFVGFWLMNFIAKTIIMLFFMLNGMTNFIKKQFVSKEVAHQKSRRQFITKTGLVLAGIPFAGLFYGMVRGKYQFKIWKQDLALGNLPESFVGKTIVQLSDMHLGSFPLHTDAIAKAIEQVNALQPDYIFFTGDMINERALEAEPWIDTIGKLTAKEGKFSVLGNHDYGDYYGPWAGKPDKIEANVLHLKSIQEKMGFTMLRNESVQLTQGDESIRLIGLENWGKGFAQHGDLAKATAGVADDEVQILLSHDPSHWDEHVLGKTKIDLAMAGHTHGSQIGVEIPAFRFSPVQFRYPRWAGLYIEKGQQLYVNRGFGYIGYGGRVGIWPEITLFTLQKA